jgi:hypothetical protein
MSPGDLTILHGYVAVVSNKMVMNGRWGTFLVRNIPENNLIIS